MRVDGPTVVNDVHSRLNRTAVPGVVHPRDLDDLRRVVRRDGERGMSLAVCGRRHAMGGQQFRAGRLLIDMSAMNNVIRSDPQGGRIEIEAGATWAAIIEAVRRLTGPDGIPWSIRQKQTGADDLSLGGAVSANVHGRGLIFGPFVEDIESLTLVMSDASIVECSRTHNAELFALAVGGYGLFGIIATVTLRLTPRLSLRRIVDILDIDEAIPAARRRIDQGCIYGDFQYAIDPTDDSFLRRGVMACYQPVDPLTPITPAQALGRDDWLKLLQLAHDDKPRAFAAYSAHYLTTHGQVYHSDTMQLSTYVPSYDQFLKEQGPRRGEESLMIGEQNVPPHHLPEFLARSRQVLRRTGVQDIYGTIRLIRQDRTTFLPWARDDYACVIFNLRTPHTPAGIARTEWTFRALNDAALALGGSFYLTYHRFATRRQIDACYPQFGRFLQLKRQYDPDELFSSDWYIHHTRGQRPGTQIQSVGYTGRGRSPGSVAVCPKPMLIPPS